MEDENFVLRKELKKRDLGDQTTDIVSTVICKSLYENFKEDLAEYLKKNKSLEDELANLKIQIVDQNSKIFESFSLLEKIKEECKMHENQESLLTLQLGKANNALDFLGSELALKDKEIEAMEIKNTDEIRKLADENEEKVLTESLKNEILEQEIARLRTSQVVLGETVKEQEVLLKSKQATFYAILRGMATTFEQETAKHQEEIQGVQMKVKEGDDWCSSLLSKASQLDLKILKAKSELIHLKDQYYTKRQEWKRENSKALRKVLSEQDESVRNLNVLTSKLKWFMEKCANLKRQTRNWRHTKDDCS